MFQDSNLNRDQLETAREKIEITNYEAHVHVQT